MKLQEKIELNPVTGLQELHMPGKITSISKDIRHLKTEKATGYRLCEVEVAYDDGSTDTVSVSVWENELKVNMYYTGLEVMLIIQTEGDYEGYAKISQLSTPNLLSFVGNYMSLIEEIYYVLIFNIHGIVAVLQFDKFPSIKYRDFIEFQQMTECPKYSVYSKFSIKENQIFFEENINDIKKMQDLLYSSSSLEHFYNWKGTINKDKIIAEKSHDYFFKEVLEIEFTFYPIK